MLILQGLMIGGVAALWTLFLSDCFEPGMIFEKYGDWLHNPERRWKKPLGLCAKCFSVWVCAVICLIAFVPFITLLAAIPTCYMIVLLSHDKLP